ncbi:hypothetical protein Scep_014230 [Stephania cephalantha]|uniref:Methyltransferase type 11 domain-containing protein n=1 Tax=Stephania cephalantha TaxID=152367 RepID=A0AAP0J0W1_9MAGN
MSGYRLKALNTTAGSQVNSASNSVVLDDETKSSSVQSTPDFEKKYVHHVYEAIAPHFSSTRFAKWPKVATFLKSLPQGAVVLDSGYGNGKQVRSKLAKVESNPSLISICAGRGNEVLVADVVNLPYRTGFVDAVISISVLHHPSTENRRKAIEELIRVVHKGGLVLITDWAVEQEDRSLVNKWTPLEHKFGEEWVGPGSPRIRSSPTLTLESIPESEEATLGNQIKGNDLKKMPAISHVTSREGVDMVASVNGIIGNQQEFFVPWHLPYHRAKVSGTFARKEDDKKGVVVYNRYYHVFVEGELERLSSGI